MNKLFSVLFILLLLGQVSYSQITDSRYFELRIYYCETDKLPDLLNRFRNHTTKLFEKHGMTNIGYWTPINNQKNALYYILAYPNKEARDASWKAFGADETWKKVKAESEVNGKIVSKVESIFMNATDFSPKIESSIKGDRVFELRIYTSPEGKSENIQARFRDHTTKLFEKHGMTNIAYFTTVESDGSQPKLLYFLAHKSEEAGRASFGTFVKDPEWISVRDTSEKNGKIVEKIESIYMNPTDFSSIR